MIRLAVIGCGERAAGYSNAGPRLRRASFAAAVDPDLRRARRTARILDAPLLAASFDELLAGHADAFDAVLIDPETEPVAPLIEKAAGAGKHVLVEMPLASSTDAADAAIDACWSAGVCLMVGQAMRFLESHRKVKERLVSGDVGAPGALCIHHWEPRTSGGAAIDRVIREIDLANWLFATPPTEVYAVSRGQPEVGSRDHDYVQVHLGFPEGGMALIDHSMTLPPGPGYFSLTMLGSAGAAYVDDHHNTQLLYVGGDNPSALDVGQGHGHIAAQLQEFVDAIEEGREPAITGADWRLAVQVAATAFGSMSAGRAARLAGGQYELV